MSWVEFFQNATRLVNKKINSKATIVNFAPKYFEKLTNVVQEYNKTTSGKMYVGICARYTRCGALASKRKCWKSNWFIIIFSSSWLKRFYLNKFSTFYFYCRETFKIRIYLTKTVISIFIWINLYSVIFVDEISNMKSTKKRRLDDFETKCAISESRCVYP